MRTIGLQLIAEKKASILANAKEEKPVGKKDVHGRDLLTLLIRANMVADIPENQRLSDDEVLARESKSIYILPVLTRGPLSRRGSNVRKSFLKF